MKTAAIIVNHNNQGDLVKLVSRIREYKIFDAVIIVDNNSDDLSEVENLADGHRIILIKAPRNGGYGYGNNIGMRRAYEDGFTHAVIANPDIEFSEECVKALLNEFTYSDNNVSGDPDNDVPAMPRTAVVAPLCRTPESSYEAPQSGWRFKTWGQELMSKGPICRRVFKNFINRGGLDLHTPDPSCEAIDADAVLGSMLAVDVAKFIRAGGYDDDVFLYCEENILGQKMKNCGFGTRLLISREYIHNHKPGLPGRQSIRNLTESELHYFEKYLCVSSFKLFISKIFFGIVYLEICIAGS